MELPDRSEVDRLRARVEALEAERRELLYATSHDLAAPLRTLTGFLGLLSRRAGPKLDPGERELLAYVEDGAAQLKVLIDGMLRVSRVGTHELALAPVELGELADAARGRAGAALVQAGTEVLVAGDGPGLQADRELLTRALAALLENAAQAGASTVAVSIQAWPGGGVLVVQDDGPGIAPEQHAKVLALLGRLHGWAERPGAGVGLTVARAVAERHGGRLELGQASTGGLRVALVIPEAVTRSP